MSWPLNGNTYLGLRSLCWQEIQKISDVWLTVHRDSVWIRNQLDVTFVLSFVLSFVSPLQVSLHVSGNHVPIFRSWRLRTVIATFWYCALTMSGIIQICLSVWVDIFYVCLVYGKSSVSGLCVVMWGVVGGGLIVVCRCGSVCKQIKETHSPLTLDLP